MRRLLLALTLGLTTTAFAAIPATTQWDVRTTGSDANGGCFDSAGTGTDYSQQDSAQVSYTDLVIGATNTQLTSSAHPFTSAAVGNCINITAGTGFTTGRYVVSSVSGSTATMDRAVGTASSTGGTGALGGSLLTVATALAPMTASNTVHVKSGTYTLTTGLTTAVTTFSIVGYGTTHNDNGTKPLITTSTNSIDMFVTTGCSGAAAFVNLSLSNTATTRGNGILQTNCHSTGSWVLFNDILDGFTDGLNSDNAGSHYDIYTAWLVGTEIKNSTSYALAYVTNNLYVMGSYIHNNASGLVGGNLSQNLVVMNSVLATTTSGRLVDFGANVSIFIVGNVFYGSTGTACNCTNGGAQFFTYQNNIFYGNTVSAINFGGSANAQWIQYYVSAANAFGANGSTGWPGSYGPTITLTANPFTNAAGGDFSLNSTSGGGALLKAAGFPLAYGTATTSSFNVGPAQGGAAATLSGGSYTFIQ